MVYKELENTDLFAMPADYALAHCISSDTALGAGIAVLFNKRFNMRAKLRKLPKEALKYPTCVYIDGVFNLITKDKYWNKPTLATMRASLEKMKEQALEMNIDKIAMPLIGCGLDRLHWANVSYIIKEIFADTDIEIVVCKI